MCIFRKSESLSGFAKLWVLGAFSLHSPGKSDKRQDLVKLGGGGGGQKVAVKLVLNAKDIASSADDIMHQITTCHQTYSLCHSSEMHCVHYVIPLV